MPDMSNVRTAVMVLLAALQSATGAPQATNAAIRVTVRTPRTMQPMAGVQVSLLRTPLPDPNQPASPAVNGTGNPDLQNYSGDLLAYLTNLAQLRGAATSSTSTIVLTICGYSGGCTQTSVPSLPSPVTGVTDANGVVEFNNLPLARYSIAAQRDGFVSATGIASPSSSDVIVDSQNLNHEVSLFLGLGASISGRVHNTSGAPLANATIEAGTLGYRDGHRTLITAAKTQTDSNGNYRISLLKQGEYLIRETAPLWKGVGTLFPGTLDVDKASTIAIQGGGEVVGIDFDIPDAPTFKISGIVPNAPARTLPNGQVDHTVPTLIYVPRDRSYPDSSLPPSVQNAKPGPNGEFEIDGIPVGSWDVYAMVPRVNVANVSRDFTGRTHVDIVDRDITGVSITLGSADIAGRVVQIGAPANAAGGIPYLGISLVALDNVTSALPTHLSSRRIPGANEEFSFQSVRPGRYSLRISGLPAGFYVSDIRLGAASIYDDGIINVETDSPGPVEVRLREGSATIEGIIKGLDANAATTLAAGVRAALVPASLARRQNLTLYQSSLVPASASFFFNSVPPGEYKIFAWKNPPPDSAEMNAEFVAKYEDQGVTVTVTAGQAKVVQVNLIP